MPGKSNKTYNSIELINKWPMIFVFQSLRNMFTHFHQCNQQAKAEISETGITDADRKDRLINIFKIIFPFLGERKQPRYIRDTFLFIRNSKIIS